MGGLNRQLASLGIKVVGASGAVVRLDPSELKGRLAGLLEAVRETRARFEALPAAIREEYTLMIRLGSAPPVEIRDFDDPATADELIARNVEVVHVERMSDTAVWIGLDDGRLNIWTEKGRLMMRFEGER